MVDEISGGFPRGSINVVPTRQVGESDRGLLGATQNEFTDKLRNKFGESQNLGNGFGGDDVADSPDLTETKFRDGTMTLKNMILRDGDEGAYGRAMCQ